MKNLFTPEDALGEPKYGQWKQVKLLKQGNKQTYISYLVFNPSTCIKISHSIGIDDNRFTTLHTRTHVLCKQYIARCTGLSLCLLLSRKEELDDTALCVIK